MTAEDALQQSELRYRRLFETAKDGILIIDAETGTVVDVNPFLTDLLGFSRESVLGKKLWELGFIRDIVANQANFAELQQEEYIRFEDKPLQASDGRRIDVEFVCNVYLEDNQKVIQCNIRDISARKAADRQLREQSEILANSREGVMIVDLDNKVTLWNFGSEEIFGWTRAEALGSAPEKLLGVDDAGLFSTLRTLVVRDGFWNGEIRSKTRDGRKITVDCRTTLVLDEADRPRARLSFLADITEKKLLEEKFLHVQRLENIGMLAAGIAHDLNNVLSPIMFAAPLLRESLSNAGDLKILDSVEQCAARGAGLVKQILGFAQGSAGEFEPTQVKYLVRDIISVIDETFPKSIQLKQQIPPDLWFVNGNPTQIHQVLLNLCVNARDAMPRGGTLTLNASNLRIDAAKVGSIPGARPGAWVLLEVADTGTGISPEVRQHIWEPFFTTKATGKGTGLGLSTVRGIVAGHRGFVELWSEVGRGTTFRVFLPAFEKEPALEPTALQPKVPDGHGELILLVDDDALIRDIMANILRSHGYRIVSCINGVEAIAFFGAHAGEISIVVTDFDMPLLGGLELTREFLKIRPDVRLLVMSGLSRTNDAGSGLQAAQELAHAFLLKPFKTKDLLDALNHLLNPPANPGS
jgi:PAS domain S-box-containing protein